jgi:hypothetical protein
MSQPQHVPLVYFLRLVTSYYSGALAHPVTHWCFCHTEDLRSGCSFKAGLQRFYIFS